MQGEGQIACGRLCCIGGCLRQDGYLARFALVTASLVVGSLA